MKQGFIICYKYDDIAYPVVYTDIVEAQDKQKEFNATNVKTVIRVVNIK